MQQKMRQNKKNRKNFKLKEVSIQLRNFLIEKTQRESNKNLIKIMHKKEKMNKKTSITKIKNICTKTYRQRGTMKKFHLSRITFRELVSNKKINGVKKYTW